VKLPKTHHRGPNSHHGALEVALAIAGMAAAGGLAGLAHMRRIARPRRRSSTRRRTAAPPDVVIEVLTELSTRTAESVAA
jgi:hypothetical protein